MLFAFESFPSAVTSSKSKRTEKKANFFQKNEENSKEGMRKKKKSVRAQNDPRPKVEFLCLYTWRYNRTTSLCYYRRLKRFGNLFEHFPCLPDSGDPLGQWGVTSDCLLFFFYFSHPICSSSSTFPYVLSPFFFLNFIVFDLFWSICLITSITSDVGSILDSYVQRKLLSVYGTSQVFCIVWKETIDWFVTSGPTNDNLIRRLVYRTRPIILFL